MTGHDKAALTLDCRGVLCPTPVLRMSEAIKQIEVGKIVELLATDPGAKRDILSWAKKSNHDVLRVEEEAGVYKFYVRKAG
jgi:tRNA 2-thiouridine synthesizing protein A